MSNKRNKYIALLISLIMLFDFVPLSVFSEEAVVVDKSESQTVPVLLDPEDGTSDEEEFWEEVISEHIDDYTVTVTVTKEAEFPIGTTVTITPLSSGTYRNEAANLFDQNDNKLGSFIRVFDITFWYDDMEIEPLVPVDVKITFDNAVELEGNNELKLIHLHEDEEAKEISAETETTQTEDSEAIESLSFQSDKFSTYIVAEEIVVYTFSESGNNYEVVLKVNSAMGLPQDAVFTVDEITKDSDLYDQYAAQVAAVINPDGAVRMPALLDISLKTADGEKIQLDNKVQVIVRLTDEDVKRGLQVVHFPGEDPFQGESAVRDAVANSSENDEIEVLDIESERLYPRLNTKENTVTFNTDSFSVFALAYTVNFEYMGRSYEMLGNSEILLSKLLEVLETGVTIRDITRVFYTGTSIELAVTDENDWLIKTIPNADEKSVLTIKTIDKVIEIKVVATGKESIDLGDAIISSADGVYLPDDATGSIEYVGENEEVISLIQESTTKAATAETVATELETSGQTEEQTTEQTEDQTTEQAEELKETLENGAAEQSAATRTFYQVYDISLENVDTENYAVGFQVEMKLSEEIQGNNLHLYHVHDNKVSEITEFDLTGDNLSFVTENFSYFVISYTVDFEYIDETGEAHTWKFPGNGSYKLSEVLTALEIEFETITGAELELVEGEEHEGALYLDKDEDGDITINSDIAFTDTYRLTVIADKKVYEITVTDFEEYNVAKLVSKTYDNDDTSFAWDMNTYRLYWYVRYQYNGEYYYAVQQVGSDAIPELKLSYLVKDGNMNNSTSPNAIQCPDPAQTNLDVWMVAGKGQDAPFDGVTPRGTTVILTGGTNSFGGYTFGVGSKVNSIYEVTAKKNKPYVVEIKFQDSSFRETTPSETGSGYKVYATFAKDDGTGTNHNYYCLTDEVSLNNEVTTVNLSRFRYNEQDHQPEQYYSGQEEVFVCIVQNGTVSNNGSINGGTTLSKGDTVGAYELASINQDVENGKTTIIFRAVTPYNTSFNALATDGTTAENVDLSDSGMNDNNWYMVTKLTKNNTGKSYYFVRALGNLHDKGGIAVTGTIDWFYENGDINSANKAVYVSGDVGETRLVHMSESGKSNSEIVGIFNQTGNDGKNEKTESKYFTGGDGLYKYTVRTVDASGQGSVTLTNTSAPTVTVSFFDTNGTTPLPNLLAEKDADNYYLYACLSNVPEYSFIMKLDTETEEKTYTIGAFVNKDDPTRIKYLTGANQYDVWIVRKKSNADLTPSDVYDRMKGNYQADPVLISQDGGKVGRTRVDMSRAYGTATNKDASIKLTKLPDLTLNSKIFTTKAATTPAADTSLTKYYYVLLTMQEDGDQVYHLQRLDVASLGEKDYTVDYLTRLDGTGKYHYAEGDSLKAQLVTSSIDSLSLENVVYGSASRTLFENGGVTAELYQIKLTQNEYMLTSELRKLDVAANTEHTVNAYFYGADKATTETIDPALGTTDDQDMGHVYYIVATLRAKQANSVAAYQIAEVDKSDIDGTITMTLPGQYQIVDAIGNAIGTNVGYAPDMFDVKVRLYHRASLPGSYSDAVGSQASDIVPGYDFMLGGQREGAEITDIKLHKAYIKDYKVRLTFDPMSPAIMSADRFYLLVKLEHQTTGLEYGFMALGEIAEGTTEKDYSDFTWYKQGSGGLEQTTVTVTGNEKATVRLLQATSGDFNVTKAVNGTDCRVVDEGDLAKACIVSYAFEQTNVDENNSTTHITDYVKLTKIPVNSDYSFTDILGQGVYYGINADVFNQQNHIQSNFAVNTYFGNGKPIEADLAGESGAFIAVDVQDSIFIGNNHSGDVLLYVTAEDAPNAPRDPRDFVYTIIMPEAELRAQVNAILQHGQSMSNELATHVPTFTPKDLGKNYIEIDTYDFPENATIYLDGDALRGYISTTSGIKLTKKPDQMIVFNFEDDAPLRLGKFEYRYSRDDAYMITDSPIGHGDTQNDNIDQIAKHVVWNVQNATDVDINICTGMYLIPQQTAKTVVSGTSSGWIITGGKVTNTDGEWHSVYGDLPSVSMTNLNVGKTIDGKTPNGSQIFNFIVEYLVKGDPDPWETIKTAQNTNGTLMVNNITRMQPGWNVYRIKESATIPGQTKTTGEYTIDGRAIYAVVKYEKKTAAGGNTSWIATNPVYYVEDRNGSIVFNEDNWTPEAASITDAFGNAGNGIRLTRQTRPAFENTTKKDRLSISKVVTGTTDNTKVFNFTLKVEVGDPSNNTFTPWLGTANTTGDEAFTILITGADSTMTTPVHVYGKDESGYDSAQFKLNALGEVSFSLKAGQTAAFNGLPDLHRYYITENNPSGNPGYAIQEGTETTIGPVVVEKNATNTETFTNEYTASGSVPLTGIKTLVNANDKTKQRSFIVAQFGFELKQGSNTIKTVYNTADGKIDFGTISYDQDDMIGATAILDNSDNPTGQREKVIEYTIHEIDGTAENAAELNTGIAFASDQTVKVKLVDNGAGAITAKVIEIRNNSNTITRPFDAADSVPVLTFTMENTYTEKTEGTITGVKKLTGRDLEAEEFNFQAVLTQIDNEPVADPTDVTKTAPTTVTGTNVAATAVDDQGEMVATANITFQTIEYFRAGVYTYTVNEVVPDAAEKLPGVTYDTKNYTVTVTVTEDAQTGELTIDPTTGIVYSKEMVFNNTWEETGISLNVHKVWVDNDNASGIRPDAITVQLYSSEDFSTPIVGKDIVLSEANNWQGGWTNLDERYTYKVQEKTVGGYSVSYTPGNGVYTVTDGKNTNNDEVTITNSRSTTPQTGTLELYKIWQDTAGNHVTNNLPEQVQFVLNGTPKTSQSIGTATCQVQLLICNAWNAFANYTSAGTWDSNNLVNKGIITVPRNSNIIVSISQPKTIKLYQKDDTYWKHTELATQGNISNGQFEVSDKEQYYIVIWQNDGTWQTLVDVLEFSGESANSDTNEYPMTLTLNEANDWYTTVSGLDSAHNTYTLTELVPSGSSSILAGYTLNGEALTISEGIVNVTPGLVIATNTIPSGALKLKKLVKLSGGAAGGTLDGTYEMTLVGTSGAAIGVDKTIVVTVAGGAMTGATIRDTSAAAGMATALTPFDEGYAVINGLPLGTYTITETNAGKDGYIWNPSVEIGTAAAQNGNTGTVTVATGQNVVIEVTNDYTPGVELPATGGPGTALYTFLGLMIILLAGGLLAFNKKRNGRENR